MRLALIGGSGVIILERWRLFAGIRYGMSGSNVQVPLFALLLALLCMRQKSNLLRYRLEKNKRRFILLSNT